MPFSIVRIINGLRGSTAVDSCGEVWTLYLWAHLAYCRPPDRCPVAMQDSAGCRGHRPICDACGGGFDYGWRRERDGAQRCVACATINLGG